MPSENNHRQLVPLVWDVNGWSQYLLKRVSLITGLNNPVLYIPVENPVQPLETPF